MDWTLPANLAAHGGSVDGLYYLILAITGVAFVLVEVGILWFIFKYRKREGHEAVYHHGSTRVELVWTAIPAVVMVFLGIYSGDIWADIKERGSMPENAVEIGVAAKQFEWNVTYPGADGQLGTGDDFTERNRLHLPADRDVVVQLSSEDVIHSFFIHVLRIKQDALPGRTIPVWFQATEPGEYELGCAELCGLGHYRMRATVTVLPPEEFDRWQQEQSAAAQEQA